MIDITLIDHRDSIIGTYDGVIHFYDQNEMEGGEIDTMYDQIYKVTKFGIDSIKFTPPLPIYYASISNEYFKYRPSNKYTGYYTTNYTTYRLDLEFKPDSMMLIFRASFAVGLAYDDHYYEYKGKY